MRDRREPAEIHRDRKGRDGMSDQEGLYDLVALGAALQRREQTIDAWADAFVVFVFLATWGAFCWAEWPGWPGPAWPFWPQFWEMALTPVVGVLPGLFGAGVAKLIANPGARVVKDWANARAARRDVERMFPARHSGSGGAAR
jgi:hypothetical protein